MALKLLPPKREKTVSSAEQSQRANRTVLRRTLFLTLEMHRPILFNELVLSDKLFEHCAEIDEKNLPSTIRPAIRTSRLRAA